MRGSSRDHSESSGAVSGEPPGNKSAATPAARPRQSPVDRILLIVIILALVALTGQWIRLTIERPMGLPWERSSEFPQLYQVDVNKADWIEWIQLDDIGQRTAHRIVADRELKGPFESIDDLQRVHGIGPATFEAIRPWLTISHDHELSSELTHSDHTGSRPANGQPAPL